MVPEGLVRGLYEHYRLLLNQQNSQFVSFRFIYLFIYLFILLFRAVPAAYGGSQAMGQIGATAASLRHSHGNAGSESRLRPTPQLTATPGSLSH